MKYPGLESSILEFKKELPKNDQIIKTIIAFCNQKGGRLVLGVDNDGTIVGLDQKLVASTMEYLDKSIYEATVPSIIPSIFSQTIGNKTILIIEVSSGMSKPYYVRSEGMENGTYIRLGRSTMRATPDIIQELQWQRLGKSYEALPVYEATVDDVDIESFKEFLDSRKDADKKKPKLEEALYAYTVVTDEHNHRYPTVAGILLFGKNPQKFFSEAFIITTHFAGIEGREAIASKDATGTLVEQFHTAYAFVIRQLEHSFSIKGPKRVETLEIPEVALREALLNAIIHRNYHIKSPIKVAVYQNRIEIFSPGGFPGPLDPQNLTMGLTYLRNVAITKVFREMDYIEKLGSGLIAIFDSYKKAKLPAPQIKEGENFIKVILPRPTRYKMVRAKEISLEDLAPIINLFETATELSMKDILENTQLARSTAGRYLEKLVTLKVLKKIGRGRAVRYKKI